MTNTKQTKTSALAEKIYEWLLYGWEKKYVTIEAIAAGTGLQQKEISHGVRVLVATYNVLEYSRRGEYRIVDLENYFDEPAPGCDDRYHSRLLYG